MTDIACLSVVQDQTEMRRECCCWRRKCGKAKWGKPRDHDQIHTNRSTAGTVDTWTLEVAVSTMRTQDHGCGVYEK